MDYKDKPSINYNINVNISGTVKLEKDGIIVKELQITPTSVDKIDHTRPRMDTPLDLGDIQVPEVKFGQEVK
jgi:hypothetical protein